MGEGDEEYLEENPYSQPLPLGEEHNEDDHEHESDPHIWTSAENARIIARKIMDKLVETSPENKEYFEANLKNFEDELDNILVSFRAETDLKSPNYFLIFHDAYNYLFQEI
ncbi:MAG: metal ABC transporter substrate-binding protein [Candidatus Peribacteria bacterium]|nr:metal ABC transporter substrate-binding protein [Candidatus Peribacteria bacterium]